MRFTEYLKQEITAKDMEYSSIKEMLRRKLYMVDIDLSLNNEEIYKNIKIESFGGRKSFKVNQENLDTIGKNITEYIRRLKETFKTDKAEDWQEHRQDLADFNDSVTLTGATAIPVYLVAFHIVVHSFSEVRYKNEMYDVITAKH